MKDEMGDRMKDFYENRYKFFLPRRTNVIIRLDGKAFHTYTRGLEKPFDRKLIEDMNETTKYLCENIQGCKLGYTQSDEISLLLTDYNDLQTDAWYDGNIQKIVSVSASLATAKFNSLRPGKLAMFDSRVFIIPYSEEVVNYFIWRQKDSERNSLSMLAQSYYSSKELDKKNCNEMQEMLFQKGINWNNVEIMLKRGRALTRQTIEKENERGKYTRNEWVIDNNIPIFTQDKIYILNQIQDETYRKRRIRSEMTG